MKKRRCILLFCLGLMLLAAAVILLPELWFRFLVEPVARIVWLVSRTLLAVDQVVYWGLLLVVVYIVGLRMLPALRGHSHPPAYQERFRVENLPAEWEDLLSLAGKTPEGRRALLRRLEAVSSAIESPAENGERTLVDLPPIRTEVRQSLPGFLRVRTTRPHGTTDLEQAFEKVLHHLETKLEPNDGTAANPDSHN